MPRSLSLLVLLIATSTVAQPLTPFVDLEINFAFYLDGIRIPAIELKRDTRFSWSMDGTPSRPDTSSWSGLSLLKFHGLHSDAHFYRDTLWMHIRRGVELMSVSFPPAEPSEQRAYTISGARIEFRTGRFVITQFPKDLHVYGVLKGWTDVGQDDQGFALVASAEGVTNETNHFDPRTEKLDAVLPCSTYREEGREWVRFKLIRTSSDHVDTMHVRSPYYSRLDLTGLEWMTGHYLWFFGKQRLDRTYPVGEFLTGNTPGTRIRILPNDPFDDERMTIELQWQGPELPIRSWFHTVQRPDGISEIRFQLAGSTVGVVPTEVKEQRLTLNISTFPVGRYVVTQEKRPGCRLRQIDILMEREVPFEVREWK